MLVHSRMFQKFARLDSREELRLGQEMIILAFDFAGARRPRRAGNGVNEIRRLAQRIAQRRLAGARWRGDDEQNSGAGELITQGFGFVRGSSPSRLCRRRRAAKSRRRSTLRRACSVRGKFPGYEFECAADRLVLAQMMRELREVTFEAGQFFRDVGAIGEEETSFSKRSSSIGEIETRPFRFVRAARCDIFSPRRDRARGPP